MHVSKLGVDADPSSAIGRLGAMLDSEAEAPVRVGALAQAAGVSARTLHRLFRRHCGAPPVAHLRRARMDGARRRFLAPGPSETVTSVAFDCGFFHLGRFAASYRAYFGEHPSQTLRRGREMATSSCREIGGT